MFSVTSVLNGAVVLLGLVSYGFGFGLESGSPAAWPVRFALLACLVAGFALLQRKSLPLAVAVLATAGFADGVVVAVTGVGDGLMWGVVAANGIQAVLAVLAVVFAREATPVDQADQYSAYVEYYNEATRRYYDQQAAYAADADRQTAHAQASAQYGAAPARPQRTQGHAGYADFTPSAVATAEPRHSRPSAAQPPTPPIGLPTSEHLATAAPPWHTADRPQRAPGD